jgi:hypothetical protein
MEISGYARIIHSASDLQIYCTDEKMIEWVCSEIIKLFPASRINHKRQLISGEDYFCEIDKLPNGKESDIAFWTLKQFCLKGWEPFEAKEGVFSVNTYSTILLRLTKGQ